MSYYAESESVGAMYSSYVPAKQAGFNIRFADARVGIPDAEVYLMPGISGNFVMPAQEVLRFEKTQPEVYVICRIALLCIFLAIYPYAF